MKDISTVIFDLDGTLLNTLDDLADGVNYALSVCRLPERTLEEIREFVGNGVLSLMELSIPQGQSNPMFEECLTVFKDYYSKNMQVKTRPYEGILSLLETLRAAGYKIAIVSNKFDSAVKELSREYFKGYIGVAIGESSRIHRKPSPVCVYKALEELKAIGEEAIYVGDSDIDVRTAHNAGIPCVGVTWGFRDREILINEGADFIISHPMELVKVLEHLNTKRRGK